MLKGCPTLMRGSPLGDAPGPEAVLSAQRCYEWEVTNSDRVSFCVACSLVPDDCVALLQPVQKMCKEGVCTLPVLLPKAPLGDGDAGAGARCWCCSSWCWDGVSSPHVLTRRPHRV